MSSVIRHLRSIRGRITLIATMLVAVTLVVASVVLMRWVQADLLESAQATLDEALESQADLLGVEAEVLTELGIDDFSDRTFEAVVDDRDVFISVFPEDGFGTSFGEMFIDNFAVAGLELDSETNEILAVYDIGFQQQLVDGELAAQVGELATEVIETGEVELGDWELVEADGDDLFTLSESSLAEVEQSVAAIRQALLFIVPSLIVAFALLIWWLVGRALRPVMSITEQVEAISSSSLDRRVPIPDTNDEVANLASVMNRMLDRLQRGGERQRQFSADASHELRSPLSTVRAAAELLEANPPPERTKRLAGDIVAESDRMDELISDLLELSRLDEDRRSPVMEETDVVALVQAELQPELADGRVALSAPPQVLVMASPRQLQRVVRNLVDNAIRHAERKILVSVTSTAAEVRLAVDDDGSGVPPADRTSIFERFARLDEARSRDGGGSGLGLALVSAIADAHEGTAVVEDSDLGGARFVVSLPAGEEGVVR